LLFLFVPDLIYCVSVTIPEKLFFKIGEVCELAGVQAHVLRYWETEFPMLAPQKNRAGQRTYRRRDVEMALRIKELLYDEQYTIAGAKKRLADELRGVTRERSASVRTKAPTRSSRPAQRQARRRVQVITTNVRLCAKSQRSCAAYSIFWKQATKSLPLCERRNDDHN